MGKGRSIMTGNIAYDARRMFSHACAFADCAIFCKKAPRSVVVRTQWYTVPEIVNSAFACEVFIKSLLIFRGLAIEEVHKKNHGLKGLWNALEENDKAASDRVKEKIKRELDIDDALFDELLENTSNAFKKWRYIYEDHGGKIHLGFLSTFREELREEGCQTFYKRSWSEYISGAEN